MRNQRAGLFILLLLAVLVTFSETASAQSCGGSAGPSLCGGAAAESSWLARGKGAARLSEEYEVKDVSYNGSSRVPNDFNESLFISRTALDVRYGVTDDWSAGLTLTYPRFFYRLKPPGGTRSESVFRGPGDTFLSVGRGFDLGPAHDAPMPSDAVIAPYEEPRHAPFLSVWAGLSLPTGEAQKPNPAFVTRDVSVSNSQTGTGTFDPMARARIEWPQSGWTFLGEVDLRAPLYENRYRYRTADTEALLVGGAVPVVPKLSASLAAMLQRTGRDQFRGDDVGVGGAKWLYLVPGVSWQATDSVSVDVGLRVPVWRRTETKLSDSRVVFQVGLTLKF